MTPIWYVIKRGNTYWTGIPDSYTDDISRARLFTEIEMEVSFVYGNEVWEPIPTKGDA
jgi:hypothetical protein